jgi:hypothetical protein
LGSHWFHINSFISLSVIVAVLATTIVVSLHANSAELKGLS